MELLTLAPGSDRIPVELFQILKDDAVESAALNMQFAICTQYAIGRLPAEEPGRLQSMGLQRDMTERLHFLPQQTALPHLTPWVLPALNTLLDTKSTSWK